LVDGQSRSPVPVLVLAVERVSVMLLSPSTSRVSTNERETVLGRQLGTPVEKVFV
jgi:hypothetical protein